MLDKAAVLKEAQKHLAKGAIDKAISELEKLVAEGPDGNTFNTIGDLYLKKGVQKTATDYYRKAAAFFWHEGFTQKAQALYKKVLNLNPADTDALYAFGELSEEKGLVTDAIKYYLATADLLSKEGKKDRILGIYEKILSLSPANVPLRIKVAEIFMREGLKSDAAREYLHVAKIHEETGDPAKAKDFFQKAIDLNPRNVEAVLGLIHLYEKAGDVKQAAARMKDATVLFPDDPEIFLRCAELSIRTNDPAGAQQCLTRIIEKDPNNVSARKMLGNIYLKSGAKEKAWQQYLPVLDGILTDENYEDAITLLETFKPLDPVETSKRLISLFRQLEEKDRLCDELVGLGDYYSSQGREDEARSCYDETLQLNPDHPAARMRVAPAQPEPEPEAAPPAPEKGPLDIEIPDLFLATEEAAEAAETEMPFAPEEAPAVSGVEEKEHITVLGEKPLDEVITEVDIFSRYGLLAEAEKLLEGLRNRYPDNIDVHTRLKALFMDMQDRERAVTECIVLSKLYKREGDEARSGQMLKEAAEINPDDPRLAEYGIIPSAERPSPAPPAVVSFGEAVTGAEPDIEDYEEEIAEADFYARQGLTIEAVKILEKLQRLFPENKDVIERLHALGRTPSVADIEEMTGSVELTDTVGVGEPSGTREEFGAPETAGPAGGFDLAGEAEEPEGAELTTDMGRFGELELEEKVSLTAREQEEGVKLPPEKPGTAEISLAGEPAAETKEEAFEDFSITESELVDAQEMPEPALDNDVLEIFQEFKKGLEKELGDEDAETHYNLGIAYKEMGLVDDAIKEFQTAKEDPKRFLQSSTMLGVCYMEKGLASLAIDVLAKALETMKEKDESYWALSYELAEAYEKNQNLTEAVSLYTSIYGWNAKFRDISAKMTLLQSHAPKTNGTGSKDKEKPKERKDRVSYL